jgi:tripartite-type tricarboxylate transporter receptor subunit TctC
MKMPRRRVLAAAALLAGCGRRKPDAGCEALAGTSIRWIVPYTPGGSYDVFSRMLEPPLEKRLRAEIVIVNEPGAGSLVGVTKLRNSPPDGRTLGIFNSPGLLAASAAGQSEYPNPAHDFDIVGRVARSQKAIATGAQSPFRTMEELLAMQERRPLLCGLTGVASDNLLNLAVTVDLLGLRVRYLTGYGGAREEMLAAIRGDLDLISLNYETIQPAVESGELRVLLQSSERPLSPHPSLSNAGLLAGPDGWAVRRAAETGRTEASALADAGALVELLGAGMVAAAPRGLPPPVLACLRGHFAAAGSDPSFLSAAEAARRTVDIAGGEQALADLLSAEAQARRFSNVLRAAAGKARE